ncbi:hypothetical protein EMPS_08771 [Entomortierella parvispora]|uniref:Uncharacterized protein n=1 Tax=Entomortierella parvispora TaxID=205924 RepID=A0A9P3HHH1_9FUNG|nr:hypothetical protein EMPS_08771 [Entomortierella parvispora]
MHISASKTILAFSSLALLLLSQNNGVEARLTAEERLEAEIKYPDNPNYCPPCLQKAMANHFPHACPKSLEPIEGTDRPNGPLPEEQRCVCVSFQDLYWMKEDCERECTFVNDPEAMKNFMPANQLPGCDRWVDFATGEEKDVEGFPKKDPNYKPKVYSDDDEKEGKEQELEDDKKKGLEEEIQAIEDEAGVKAEIDTKANTDEVVADEIVEESIVAKEEEQEEEAKDEESNDAEDIVTEMEKDEERITALKDDEVTAEEIVAEEVAEAQEIAAKKEVASEVEVVADEDVIAEEVAEAQEIAAKNEAASEVEVVADEEETREVPAKDEL